MCVLHVFKVDLTTIIKKPLNPKLVVKAKLKKFCTNLFVKRNRIVFGQVYSFALISRLKKETVSVRRLTWRLKPESINSSLQYQIDQNQDFLLAPNFKKKSASQSSYSFKRAWGKRSKICVTCTSNKVAWLKINWIPNTSFGFSFFQLTINFQKVPVLVVRSKA